MQFTLFCKCWLSSQLEDTYMHEPEACAMWQQDIDADWMKTMSFNSKFITNYNYPLLLWNLCVCLELLIFCPVFSNHSQSWFKCCKIRVWQDYKINFWFEAMKTKSHLFWLKVLMIVLNPLFLSWNVSYISYSLL